METKSIGDGLQEVARIGNLRHLEDPDLGTSKYIWSRVIPLIPTSGYFMSRVESSPFGLGAVCAQQMSGGDCFELSTRVRNYTLGRWSWILLVVQ